MVEAVKQNFPQREIADASFELQTEIDAGERIVVGVNAYRHEDDDAAADPAHRPGARAQADRPRAGRPRAPRRRGGRGGARRAAQAAAQPATNLMPRAARRRPRPRHRGRDRRRAAGRLGRLHRDPGLLSARTPPTRCAQSRRLRRIAHGGAVRSGSSPLAAVACRRRHPGARRARARSRRRQRLLAASRSRSSAATRSRFRWARRRPAQRRRHERARTASARAASAAGTLPQDAHPPRHVPDRLHDPPAAWTMKLRVR